MIPNPPIPLGDGLLPATRQSVPGMSWGALWMRGDVEAYKRFYIRFQSDMTMLPTGRQQAPLYWSWGTGDGYYVLDRQSIATHEFGHAIPLGHPGDL